MDDDTKVSEWMKGFIAAAYLLTGDDNASYDGYVELRDEYLESQKITEDG